MAEQMKPSGIDWIGDIPESWKVRPLKYLAKCNQDVLLETTAPDYSFRYVDIGSVTYERGITGYQELRFEDSPSRARRKVSVGDTIISTVRTYLKAIAIISDSENVIVSTGFAVYTPDEAIYPQYLYYFCKSEGFVQEIDKNSYGIAYPAINTDLLSRICIAYPCYEEQQAIADFLDKECAQIDSITADLEKQIALLQQYKKSLITETVTKGLDKSVPMKDSGTDWIPYEIPEQWELSKIKYIFNLRDEKNYRPLEEVNLISLYTDLGVVQHCDLETTTGNKAYTADGYKKVYVDDVVVNIILCWMGAIGISQYEGVTSPAYDVYYAIDKEVICPQYYHYLFKIEQFHGKCYSVGRGIMAMRWRTYSSEFKNITVPVPPMQEQREIAEFLDKKCSIIDQIILQKEKQLKSIQEHKKSLIYEYVTGKKRVKEVQ